MGHGIDLPDPLVTDAGEAVTSVDEWVKIRRPEVLRLFQKQVYGRTPDFKGQVQFKLEDEDRNYLEGTAIRKQVSIEITTGTETLKAQVLIYLPFCAVKEPAPVFTLLNFGGNQTIEPDPGIYLPEGWLPERYSPAEGLRGSKSSRYPLADILSNGYGLVTAYCGDFDPDFHDGFKNGIHPLLDGPDERQPDAWATVAAWAWGLSRIMDYLETDAEVDHTRVAVLGHSRLGKTSLWAGALDQRFSIIISNNSGCTGAAVARNRKGETVEVINTSFPHWFCDNYKHFNDREDTLPVDQHMLIALAAPRPVYVASATEDKWADPEGEFMACVGAESVYSLYGLGGVGTKVMPDPDTPLNVGYIGYHLRTGKHDLTAYDWARYMDFAERHWKPDSE